MAIYRIATDSGSGEVEAASPDEAVALYYAGERSAPTTVAEWEEWLEAVGAYGVIVEDGVVVAEVK